MEKTMPKRNFRLKMQHACGSDELRPVFSNVKFENGYMYATDAHIIVRAAVLAFSDFDPSEVDILNGKFLDVDTFKKVIACKHVVVTEEGITDLKTKALYRFAEVEKYPDVEAVMNVGPRNEIDEIGIQHNVLSRMLKVISSSGFNGARYQFCAKNKGITILSNDSTLSENEFKGILMPAMIYG